MDIVNFDALKAQGKVLPANDVDLTEDYFLIGKRNVHYNTNSFKATEYPIYAIKAGDVIGANTKYKVYTALLTQTGVTAPTATVLENTLGDITFTYGSAGYYEVNSANLFTEGKTFTIIGSPMEGVINGIISGANYQTPNVISINTVNFPTNEGISDELYLTPFEIRVYN
jgi:hypothetical protein